MIASVLSTNNSPAASESARSHSNHFVSSPPRRDQEPSAARSEHLSLYTCSVGRSSTVAGGSPLPLRTLQANRNNSNSSSSPYGKGRLFSCSSTSAWRQPSTTAGDEQQLQLLMDVDVDETLQHQHPLSRSVSTDVLKYEVAYTEQEARTLLLLVEEEERRCFFRAFRAIMPLIRIAQAEWSGCPYLSIAAHRREEQPLLLAASAECDEGPSCPPPPVDEVVDRYVQSVIEKRPHRSRLHLDGTVSSEGAAANAGHQNVAGSGSGSGYDRFLQHQYATARAPPPLPLHRGSTSSVSSQSQPSFRHNNNNNNNHSNNSALLLSSARWNASTNVSSTAAPTHSQQTQTPSPRNRHPNNNNNSNHSAVIRDRPIADAGRERMTSYVQYDRFFKMVYGTGDAVVAEARERGDARRLVRSRNKKSTSRAAGGGDRPTVAWQSSGDSISSSSSSLAVIAKERKARLAVEEEWVAALQQLVRLFLQEGHRRIGTTTHNNTNHNNIRSGALPTPALYYCQPLHATVNSPTLALEPDDDCPYAIRRGDQLVAIEGRHVTTVAEVRRWVLSVDWRLCKEQYLTLSRNGVKRVIRVTEHAAS